MLVRDQGEAPEEPPFPPIPHETTHDTESGNERGTLAYARREPGTANSEIFFNVGDNFVLDTDAGDPTRDGYGYATFGRVAGGWRCWTRSTGSRRTRPPPRKWFRDRS